MKEKKPVGRPTKYNPIFIKKVDEYLEVNQDKYYSFHKTRGEKSDSYDRNIKVKLPTINGFCLFINVPERTLYDWKAQHEEFSQSLDKIVKEQERRLLNMGLSGDYNPVIAKLILSSNHGYKEKSDVTSDDKAFPITGIEINVRKED